MSQIRDKFDPRPMIFIGILLTAWPAWTMAHWTVDVGPWDVALPNFIQGCATSFIWSPLTRLTLSRIDDRVRDQGVSLYYLNFDIGASIGTAAIIGLHARHSQINRATLSEFVNPFNEALCGAAVPDTWSIAEASGLAALENEVTRQATMIAYNNSFLVISLTVIALIPILLLFRHRRPPADPAE